MAGETPYRRDVFMLGALAYLILFGEKPAKVSDTYVWSPRSNDPSGGVLDDVIKRALNKQPAQRFSNARDMLAAI